ncbi:MAG TPA: toll/interleukin-1 receptor domain-containing protein [Pirellulaceae bacterium]|jgi:hypothetical protein|nr:toll/interleukin-1 receptor domain-containing protein [Pirellulaceae bacterium]
MFFLSYRHDDSKSATGHIYDRLESTFSAPCVFRDRESLQYGSAFPEGLRQGVLRSDVVLVVIGRKWLEILRLRAAGGETDYVREEVSLAIQTPSVHVLPVLVDGAKLPSSAELAEFPDLQPLALQHAREIRPEPEFGRDLRALEQHLRPYARRRKLRLWRRRGVAALLGLALLGTAAWGTEAALREAPAGPTAAARADRVIVGGDAMTLPVRLVYAAKTGKFRSFPVQSSVTEESSYRLPDDLVPVREAFAAEQAERRAAQLESVWNGRLYRLAGWNLLAPARENDPFSLALRMEPGDYYDFVVTHAKLKSVEVADKDGNPASAWKKYVESYPAENRQPNPALSNYLGVSLTVVTGDGYVILHRRSSRNAIVPDYMHVSVAEGTAWPADGADEPAALMYNTAIRGLREELCLTDVRVEDVKFLGLVYSTDLAQFDLSGFVSVPATSKEIEAAVEGCRDQIFENERMRFEPFNGPNIAKVLRDEPRWSPFAVSSLVLALYHQYGVTPVDRDFAAIFAGSPVELIDFEFVPK